MSKIAFLFSGQGSQYPGMGQELYGEFSEVRKIYDEASSVFGFDAAETSFHGEAEQIARTQISQPLIYTLSVAVFSAIRGKIGGEYAAAGHSLGEYAALCCTGCYSVRQGMEMIKVRSEAMRQCAEKKGGSMAAVIGIPPEVIAEVCRNIDGYVLPVNFNSAAQTVVAGEDSAVQSACEALASKGAKTIKLAVSSAFHSEFMSEASEILHDYLKNLSFGQPEVPFYSNLTGKKEMGIPDFAEYFKQHLVSPVLFTSQLAAMQKDGYDTFVEIGPGRILSGLVKKTLKDVSVYNIEDKKSLEKALTALA